MPIRNEFFGVWKTLLVGDQFVLAQQASRKRTMEAGPNPLIQGTPKNRVLNIGTAQETYNLTAPLLVGGAAPLDGRKFMVSALKKALDPTNTTLPLITSANITVGSSNASVTVAMLSDGKPPTDVTKIPFILLPDVPANFTFNGKNHGNNVPKVLLDPAVSAPTRLARHWDFRVNIGGFVYYILDASIQVQVGTEKMHFLSGSVDGMTGYGANNQYPTVTTGDEPWANWGTQFPWIGVTSVSVSGSGKAVALLKDYSGDGDFFDNEAQFAHQLQNGSSANDEAVNVSWLGSELTLQKPGQTVSAPSNFNLEMWDATASNGAGAWVELFKENPGDANPVIDLRKSVISEHNLTATTKLVTVDFAFHNWVG
jgi:hypothetical protein